MKSSGIFKITLLVVVLFSCLQSFSQELLATVTVNSDKIRSTERSVFDDMENAFEQFLNNRKWSTDTFKPHERIKCHFNIIIDDMPTIGQFTASVQIQSARPIFNTNYESTLFNFADRDWQFEYVESQPLDFSDNGFTTNLTSLLAYYAYIIIGFDYDSFSDLGGTNYFQKALNVVNNAQQTNRGGWKSLESNRNRYWLIENLTNKRMEPIRSGYYTYHIQGLDQFSEEPDKSRIKIIPVLNSLFQIKKQSPASILVISFLDAKSSELVNIFSEGDMQVRRQAYNILTQVNPAKREDYEKILSN